MVPTRELAAERCGEKPPNLLIWRQLAPAARRIVRVGHSRVHHDHPNDPRRIVASPAVTVPIGAVAATLLGLMLPGALWLPFAATGVADISSMTCCTRICIWVARKRRSSAGCGRGICATTSQMPEETSARARNERVAAAGRRWPDSDR